MNDGRFQTLWRVSAATLTVLLCASCALRAKEDGPVIRASQFGAAPDDGKDDTAAVQAAIDKLVTVDGARLVFEKGQYDFAAGKNPRSKRVAMLFRDAKNITIDGRAATLMFSGLTSSLVFQRCRGVTVRDLTIDWARPPFSVGTVKATSKQSLDVQVEPAFPVKGGEPVEALMEYDPATRLPRRRGREAYHVVQ